MAKIQIFKMLPENSEAISKFIETHKILEQGILISEGTIGLMYREQSDWGLSKQDTLSALSGELSKAQKQYAVQEGLRRGYVAMVGYYDKKGRKIESEIEGIDKEIKDLETETNAKVRATEYEYLKEQAVTIESEYKKANKEAKPALLEQLHITNEKIKAVEPEVEAINKEFQAQLDVLMVKKANLAGKLKQADQKKADNEDFVENCSEDRDHAMEFIRTTTSYIKEIELIEE